MPVFAGEHQCVPSLGRLFGDHVLLLIVQAWLRVEALLLLDQIKPIEQLVPVS